MKSAVVLGLALVLGACTKKQNLTEKVLYLASPSEVKGMDPAYASDKYSSDEVLRVFEGLLEYHYLKRPYKLVPAIAKELPQVSADGLTYTFKLRDDVFFHDDEAFPGGKGRKVKASDFVYSMKRIADPKIQSTGWWVVDGKIAGLNEWREANSGKPEVDYTSEIEGLKAIDDSTVQYKLTRPFPQFLYALAMPFNVVVAPEVVAKYGKEFLNHPVGTGPFTLKKFTQSGRMEYNKNPNYRDVRYPTEGSEGDAEKGLLKDAGKKLPLVDKIIVQVMRESQPRWLSFQKGKLDAAAIPKDNFDQVITPDKNLSADLVKKGITLSITAALDVTYMSFNHADPLFKNNVNLRRAMSLAYDRNEVNRLFYNGTGFKAQSLVPPGIAGNIKGYENTYAKFDLEKAKEYLAKAGYPGGKGLPEVVLEARSSTVSRQMGEHFAKSMAKIGIKVRNSFNTWPELLKKINTKTAQMYSLAWGADYPDAENFLQLLYGPNEAPGANGSNYDSAEYNTLFKKASMLQDGLERTALYEKLNRMAAEDVPWIFGFHRTAYSLTHSWLKNYKFTEFTGRSVKFLNVDLEVKKKMLEQF